MHHYRLENNELWCEDVRVRDVAEEIQTPFYVYSQRTILENYMTVDGALDGLDSLVCFAVKANSNPEILSQLARHGCGADVVSRGELYLALASGIPPHKIVFAGV
ncbi:diaminopimelate decarboxylase, partial [bacterium]|nr:diaminopimelate decarboxylase [bacterium]